MTRSCEYGKTVWKIYCLLSSQWNDPILVCCVFFFLILVIGYMDVMYRVDSKFINEETWYEHKFVGFSVRLSVFVEGF